MCVVLGVMYICDSITKESIKGTLFDRYNYVV